MNSSFCQRLHLSNVRSQRCSPSLLILSFRFSFLFILIEVWCFHFFQQIQFPWRVAARWAESKCTEHSLGFLQLSVKMEKMKKENSKWLKKNQSLEIQNWNWKIGRIRYCVSSQWNVRTYQRVTDWLEVFDARTFFQTVHHRVSRECTYWSYARTQMYIY